MDQDKTRVVFRTWKKGGDVIALFPGIDMGNGFCSSYEHVGQHGAAKYHGVIEVTSPAKPEDYYDLAQELREIGYNLEIHRRK